MGWATKVATQLNLYFSISIVELLVNFVIKDYFDKTMPVNCKKYKLKIIVLTRNQNGMIGINEPKSQPHDPRAS